MQEAIARGKKVVQWVKNTYLFILFSVAFVAGIFVVGPFMDSEVYDWAKDQVQSNALLAEVIDVQGMIADMLVASTVPMLIVWAIAFYVHSIFKSDNELFNDFYSSVSALLGGPTKIVFVLTGLLLGVCVFGWWTYGGSPGIIMATVFALFMLALGFYIKYSSSPKIKKWNHIDNHAFKYAIACCVMAAGAHLWTVFSDPYHLWNAVNDAYSLTH
jgi:hypothetical protein